MCLAFRGCATRTSPVLRPSLSGLPDEICTKLIDYFVFPWHPGRCRFAVSVLFAPVSFGKRTNRPD